MALWAIGFHFDVSTEITTNWGDIFCLRVCLFVCVRVCPQLLPACVNWSVHRLIMRQLYSQSVYSICVHTTQTMGKMQSVIEEKYLHECWHCSLGHSNDIFQTVYPLPQTQMHKQKSHPPSPRRGTFCMGKQTGRLPGYKGRWADWGKAGGQAGRPTSMQAERKTSS